MKTILFIYFWSISLVGITAQTKAIVNINGPLRSQPSVNADTIVILESDTEIEIIEVAKHPYFKVKYKEYEGYLSVAMLKSTPEIKSMTTEMPGFKPQWGGVTRSQNVIQQDKRTYGVPDEESEYRSGGYISRTLIWHCVNGKYISITYTMENGRSDWKRDHTYTSKCIR